MCVCVSGYMCECVCPCVCVIYIYSICEHADSEQYTHVTYPDQKRTLSVLFYSSLSYSFQTVLTIWAIFLSLPLLKCIVLKKKCFLLSSLYIFLGSNSSKREELCLWCDLCIGRVGSIARTYDAWCDCRVDEIVLAET